MIQSRSQSPDTGISAGIVSTKLTGVAVGANAGLNMKPVKFVKKKSEIIANGPNLAACKRGNLRGNSIVRSPCERWSKDHQGLITATLATHGGTDFQRTLKSKPWL